MREQAATYHDSMDGQGNKQRFRQEIIEHKAHAEKLAKDLENAETMKKHYYATSEKNSAELSEIHAFLDAVPNPPPTSPGENQYQKLSVMTRLSVFFATRQTLGA
jgi:hypothetical protein